MSDVVGQFETQDLEGTTTHFNGTVGTSPVNIPASAGGVISEFMLYVPKQPGNNVIIQVSFDGGSNYFDVNERDTLSVSPKGGVTQAKIRSTNGNRDYQAIINRELV